MLNSAGGLEQNFESPSRANGVHQQRARSRFRFAQLAGFQTAAETLAAQVTATDAALARFKRHRSGGVDLDDGTPGVPPAPDDGRANDLHDALNQGST